VLRWLARKIVGRQEGATPVESFVVEVIRSSGIKKGVAGIKGFPARYTPTVGFFAAVFALADYGNALLEEGREVGELAASILPLLFANDEARDRALRKIQSSIESKEFMDLVLEIESRTEQAHERYASGPAGINHLIEEMSFVHEYL
jgi:hypothetical protein